MSAWIRNTQSEVEFWVFKFRQGVPGGETRDFCTAPGPRGRFGLKAQKRQMEGKSKIR